MTAIIHGGLLALGLILPLGVQNIFLFNQGAVQRKLTHALPAFLTAALCDTLLIIAAVLGVSAIVLKVEWLRITIIIVGVFFLLYIAQSIWRSPAPQDSQKERLGAKKQMIFAASVSLLNPHAIMDTIGVIGSSSLAYSGDELFYFTLSCIAVSWIFFLFLLILGATFKKLSLRESVFLTINKVSALFIIGTAIYLVSTLFS